MNFRFVAAASLLGYLLHPAISSAAATAAAAAPPVAAPAGSDNVQDPGNPYFIITERNVFHLNPIPPPPEPEKPKEDLPVVKISGFIKVGNSSKALFSSTLKNKKDEPVYYSLAEGEKQGFLELVRIYPDNERVDILNSGVKMTLSIKEDTLKPGAGVPAATGGPKDNGLQSAFRHRPGLPGMPGMPGAQGMGDGNRQGRPGFPNFPPRPWRGQGVQGQ
jgi:hypothetical protein